MNITLFGASGKVGRQVLAQLLAKNHQVAAFVHGDAPLRASNNLTIVQGDVHSAEDIQKALENAELVISCLGSWGTRSKDILSSAMAHIVPAMEAKGIHRIISLTGSGAYTPNDTPSLVDRLNHSMLRVVAPDIINDSESHLRTLRSSNLDWTVLRSPVMTSAKQPASPGYKLNRSAPFPFASIPRISVATVMVDQIDDISWLRQAPHLHKN